MSEVQDQEILLRRPPGCLTRFRLDRYLAGELEADDAARVTAHLEGCEACKALQASIEAEKQAFRTRIPFEAFAAELERRVSAEERGVDPLFAAAAAAVEQGRSSVAKAERRERWGERWTRAIVERWRALSTSSLIGLAVAAMMVAVIGPRLIQQPPYVGMRSAGIEPGELEVYRLADRELGPAQSGAVFHEGDRLEFVLHPGSRRYLHLVSVDATGHLTAFFPREGGESMRLGRGSEVFLPNSIRLDDYVGLERIFAVYTDEPIDVGVVEAAVKTLLRQEPTPLALDRIVSLPIPGASQVSFLMVKE